jgi:hypothetical protein
MLLALAQKPPLQIDPGSFGSIGKLCMYQKKVSSSEPPAVRYENQDFSNRFLLVVSDLSIHVASQRVVIGHSLNLRLYFEYL